MRRKKRKGALLDAKTVIEEVLTSEGFKKPLARICVSWKDIVGEKVSKHATPVRLENRVLLVTVDSSSWANELSFLKPEIKERIDALLSPGQVVDIHFRVRA